MAQKNTTKLFIGVIIIIVFGLGIYWYVTSQYVYIDKSVIQAPVISLSSENSDILQQVFVKVGDSVIANQSIARVGDQIIKAKVAGLIVSVNQNIGQFENALSGQAVVATMIDPTQLRVVGQVQEDKGFVDIKVGQPAEFTVDAFGSQKFYGVVDEVAPTSEASDVVFSVSDNRQEQNFDVKIKFDTNTYAQLKNGMSAKVWVYKTK